MRYSNNWRSFIILIIEGWSLELREKAITQEGDLNCNNQPTSAFMDDRLCSKEEANMKRQANHKYMGIQYKLQNKTKYLCLVKYRTQNLAFVWDNHMGLSCSTKLSIYCGANPSHSLHNIDSLLNKSCMFWKLFLFLFLVVVVVVVLWMTFWKKKKLITIFYIFVFQFLNKKIWSI